MCECKGENTAFLPFMHRNDAFMGGNMKSSECFFEKLLKSMERASELGKPGIRIVENHTYIDDYEGMTREERMKFWGITESE